MLGDYVYGYLGALAGIVGFVAARLVGRSRSVREARSRAAAYNLARSVRNGDSHAVRHGYADGHGNTNGHGDSGSDGHGHDDGDPGPGSLVRETGRRAIRRNYHRFGPAAAGRRSSARIADAAALA